MCEMSPAKSEAPDETGCGVIRDGRTVAKIRGVGLNIAMWGGPVIGCRTDGSNCGGVPAGVVGVGVLQVIKQTARGANAEVNSAKCMYLELGVRLSGGLRCGVGHGAWQPGM